MLDAIELLARAGIEFDREAMELAAWFHDAIYDTGRDDNEDRSAEVARELLASSPIRDEVARLVLVTKTHKVSDDDVNGVSDEDFKPARARVLPRCWTDRFSTRRPAVSAGRNGHAATSPKKSPRSPADCSPGRLRTPARRRLGCDAMPQRSAGLCRRRLLDRRVVRCPRGTGRVGRVTA
jgi:hypothetical protein